MTDKAYKTEAARLAKLPRAERFEELLDFPTTHLIKAIGAREGFTGTVRAWLRANGFDNVIPVERLSAKGNYVSVSIELRVDSGAQLDDVYSGLERLPGLKYLL